jgi:chaperonin GroES
MSKTIIKPISDRVLVSPIESESTMPSGLIIPNSSKEKPKQGIVIDVGTTLEVKVNDTVLYGENAGTEIKVKNEKYLIMNEREILAIIEQ